jgi:hypothetical protein
MQRELPNFCTLAMSLGITGLFAVGHPAEVRAQTVFCPATFPGSNSAPVALANGACTNGQDGAFSGAALASQALSELSQTTTQATSREIGKAVAERRDREREPRPVERRDREREPRPVERRPVAQPERAVRAAPVARREVKAARKIERHAPPPPLEPAVRFGTWIQVFGDYQKRDAAGPAILNCCTIHPPPGGQPGLALNIQTRTGTVGFVGGADLTSRALFSANDGVIAGVTAGYTSSLLKLSTSAAFISQLFVGTGVSSTRATVSGPTAGLYATYFNGGFSSDVILKLDFLSLSETFNDLLATTGAPVPPFVPFAGGGSVNLLNSSVIGNLNYRFDLYPNLWIEPTVGAQYTNSSYGSGAAQLGLADGNLVRVQGGARFGTSTLISNRVLMTTTLTGLAYNDVLVEGGFIPVSAFQGNNLLVQADQGLMRGQGTLALNFDFGDGMSSFAQGDVYGGAHLFGAGGKAGLRYQW